MRKLFIRVWLPLVACFVLYLVYSYQAGGFDPRILASDKDVTVTYSSDAITFSPVRQMRRSSLIFIPGSLVEPTAYAPLAHAVAKQGYTAIIVKLPFRLTALESQRQTILTRIKAIIRDGDSTTKWVIAGHSAGGVIACRIARDDSDRLTGVVLIGTSHPRDFDLSQSPLDFTKISASRDGLASPGEVKANASKLPIDTNWITIEGGNHSHFGYYGFQLGDHRATITRASQQSQTLKALLDSLDRARAAN